jgi:hypothetical protein
VVTPKQRFKIGTKVVFRLGDQDVDAVVIDVWNDRDEHIRVEFDGYDDDGPIALLLTADLLRIA